MVVGATAGVGAAGVGVGGGGGAGVAVGFGLGAGVAVAEGVSSGVAVAVTDGVSPGVGVLSAVDDADVGVKDVWLWYIVPFHLDNASARMGAFARAWLNVTGTLAMPSLSVVPLNVRFTGSSSRT